MFIIFETVKIVEKLKGIITKSTGSWYTVLADDGKRYKCRLKGRLRLEGSKSTNPVTIGDHVTFHFDPILNYSVIDRVSERRNFLVRKSANLSKQTHVIAANIDHSLLLASLREPRISSAFIDRFLVISSAYEIEPVIVFTKIDLYGEKEIKLLDWYRELYHSLGYTVFETAAMQNTGIENLKKFITGNTCLLIGQSGVGKSTLLNTINPELKLKTKPISRYTGKGQHATTFYDMHQLGTDTFIIDSPGIRELGLVDFEAWEIGLFFPEIKEKAAHCKFNTCLHINEPGCGIQSAVEQGSITEERYINYLKILNDFETR